MNKEEDLKLYHAGCLVQFIRELDRHDPVEHAGALSFILAGTIGQVEENDGRSVLISIPDPNDPAKKQLLRLYPTSSVEDDCSLDHVRLLRFSPSFAHEGSEMEDPYPSDEDDSFLDADFTGGDDSFLDLTDDEVRRVNELWPMISDSKGGAR